MRELPSFPTRRSSDLSGRGGAAGRQRQGTHRTRGRGGIRAERRRDAVWQTGCGQSKDRKSTRLNSSHLGISYAVFCMKKQSARRRVKTEVPSATSTVH